MTSLNILTPGNYVPAIAIDYAAADGTAVAVSAANPLPMAAVTDLPATSTPLTGTVAASAVVGPFTPQMGRDVWAALVGSGASGSAQLLRSTDGGATQLGLTAGGKPWAVWSFAGVSGVIANEAVVTASDAAIYYLAIVLSGGSVTYRLGQ